MMMEIFNDKGKPFMLKTMRNSINMYTTLSERLKQAGIREAKRFKGEDGNNKKGKKKGHFKKSFSEDYTNNFCEKTKRFRKPLKNYIGPCLMNSAQNRSKKKDFRGRLVPNNSEEFRDKNAEDKELETIIASLDFIEDCQKYKKKVRTSYDDLRLRNQRKTVNRITSREKQDSDKKESKERAKESKEAVPKVEATLNEKLNTKAAEGVAESMLPKKLSSGDIAKIDKRYLESIHSYVKRDINNEKKSKRKPKVVEKESENESTEIGDTEKQIQPEKKNKIPGKDFFERKTKIIEWQNASGKQKDVGQTPTAEPADARIVRDLTKSEEQIKLKKATNLLDNSKLKTKVVTHSKTDVNDIDRKKRKPRNKLMKNNFKEFVETSLPSELSKVADVKELWRRQTFLKKSENSLTSKSSCTVHDGDDYPWSKNLESYKILRRLVQQEIDTILKPDIKKCKGEEKPQRSEENEKSKPELPKENDLPLLKRKLLKAEQEGRLPKSKPLNFLSEDVPTEANPKLVIPEGEAKEGGKIPKKLIENWSILNRLEQAFIGIGTPTFPDKKNVGNAKKGTKGKHAEETTASHMKDGKKIQKTKEVTKRENKVTTNQISSVKKKEETPDKTVKKAENGDKARKESPRANKSKKNQKRDTNIGKVLIGEDRMSKEKTQKKKKVQSRPDRKQSSKTSLKQNIPDSKGKRNGSQVGARPKSSAINKTKFQTKNSKTPLSLSKKKNSKENLERTKTFNVIPVDTMTIQPRKSKSFDINIANLEGRSKTLDSKSCNDFFENENETVAKIQPTAPRKPTKKPSIGATPWEQQGETPESGGQECLTANRETSLPPEPKSNTADMENEKAEMTEELQRELFQSEVKNVDKMSDSSTDDSNSDVHKSTFKERAVKGRSFLSVHVKQHCDQVCRKLPFIEEKVDPTCSTEKVETNEKISSSYSSVISTSTYDVIDTNIHHNLINKGVLRNRPQAQQDVSPRFTLSSVKSSDSRGFNEDDDQEQDEVRTRKQPLWEQDISHYRTIVKDIISQYKRIDGFLKQNEQVVNFSGTSGSLATVEDDESKTDMHHMNLQQYRKKIMTEYEKMPIFEYKSKLQESKEGNTHSACARKRNLTVAKDLTTDIDVDVKDYQPNIHTILDSQLYVEKIVKRDASSEKPKEKKSSLQDIVVRKNEKKVCTEDRHRSSSVTKVLLPSRTQFIRSSARKLAIPEASLQNLMSESTCCYLVTETDSYSSEMETDAREMSRSFHPLRSFGS